MGSRWLGDRGCAPVPAVSIAGEKRGQKTAGEIPSYRQELGKERGISEGFRTQRAAHSSVLVVWVKDGSLEPSTGDFGSERA